MARTKGKVAEREVAALMQTWWTQIEPEARFVRTPMSGGWGAPAVRTEFRASGDLMTTSSIFPFTVEVKRREGWNMKWFAAGKMSPVWGWWRQSQVQAKELGKEPMLWFRRNRQPWLVLISLGYMLTRKRLPQPFLRWTHEELGGIDIGYRVPVCFYAETLLSMHPRRFLL